ncbi:MAG TPA: hypothetical protein VEU98_07040, partial [Candidatus Eremiobacteraceae bacterium]|nr:hypothetical protein [Candidatus Eremiobacteraceae bacterium]
MPIFDKSKAPCLRNFCTLGVSTLSFALALHSGPAKNAGLKPAWAGRPGATFNSSQSLDEVDKKSSGCVSCHTATDEPTMHPTKTVHLGCTDCHGGNSSEAIAAGTVPNSAEYKTVKERAHVQPRNAAFKNRANLPERAHTLWLKESAEYIKFVNPGDLRVAPETCGAVGCHTAEVRAVSTSMMTHSAFLWGAALYNNGGFPAKNGHFGES